MIRSSAPGNELRVHHCARDPSVAVRERVHLADEEHHVDGPLEGGLQAPEQGESLFKRARNQIGSHEHGQSGPVLLLLEFAPATFQGVPP